MLDLLESCLKDSYHSIQETLWNNVCWCQRQSRERIQYHSRVMIMSLKAASLGLNMVAACHVLLMDLWWNSTTEDQAIEGAHRIGQTCPVSVLWLTVKDTAEDRIFALQQKKGELWYHLHLERMRPKHLFMVD